MTMREELIIVVEVAAVELGSKVKVKPTAIIAGKTTTLAPISQ
jgi:hypothetical protein